MLQGQQIVEHALVVLCLIQLGDLGLKITLGEGKLLGSFGEGDIEVLSQEGHDLCDLLGLGLRGNEMHIR